jgi:hypothetical protein
MAISRVDTVTTTTSSTATTITPTAATGVASGDLLIVVCTASRAAAVFSAASYTGWTILHDQNSDSYNTRVLTRIADGSAADAPPQMDYTGATAAAIAIAAAYRGVDTTTPFIAESLVNYTTAGTLVNGPSLTNTDAAAWGVFWAGARSTIPTAPPVSWTPGSGLLELEDSDTGLTNANDCPNTWCDSNGTVATGSVTYSATLSESEARSRAWSGLLKPAVVGGGTDYTASPADTVGLTDSASTTLGDQTWVSARDWVGTDPWPVGDSATGAAVSPADTVHGTDAVSGLLTVARSAADTAGLTDSVTATIGNVANPASTLGLTDTVTVTKNLVRALADTAGLSDAVTVTKNLARSAADSLGLTDRLPLLPPSTVTAVPVSTTRVDLSWDVVAGATGYDVLRDGVALVSDQPGHTYTDTGVAAGQTYVYTVVAVRTTTG